MNFQTLLTAVQKTDAVPLTEKDFQRLMKFGRLYTGVPNRQKYTCYSLVRVPNSMAVEGVRFMTYAVGDNGTRNEYYIDARGIMPDCYTIRSLPLYDGEHLPVVKEVYHGESWRG